LATPRPYTATFSSFSPEEHKVMTRRLTRSAALPSGWLLAVGMLLPQASLCQAVLVLDVAGLTGDSTLAGYQGWSDVDHFAISVKRNVPSPLHVSASSSSISTHMFFFALSNATIPKVTLDILVAPRPEFPPVRVASWRLDNARVVEFGTVGGSDGNSADSYLIDYTKIQYRFWPESGGDIIVQWDKVAGTGTIADNSAGASLVLFTGSPGLLPEPSPGDFNDDGAVDGRDFLVWQRGESPDPLSVTDIAAWREHFGEALALAQTAVTVPEPSTAVTAAVATWGVFGAQRAKHRRTNRGRRTGATNKLMNS
jgi:hypothetical protein